VELRAKDADDENEAFVAKLEDMRVEVAKRDIQRKFEAMQKQESIGRKFAGIGQAVNNAAGGSLGGAGFTTDHHGNVIQVNQGLPHMAKKYETSVTI